MLVAIVAISMALAPLLMITNENFIQPLFARGGQIRDADVIDESARVIIAGHGRFGMTVGRMLQGKGYKTVVLDHDAEQIDALRRFGFKLFYGDASRVDLLEAAGARTAEVLVIAIDEREKISEIIATAKKHFPNLRIFARAFDRVHAYEILNAGVDDVYREVFSSSLDMGEQVLVALGQDPLEAHRAARPSRASMRKSFANRPAMPATTKRWSISSATAAPNFHAYWPATAPYRLWLVIEPGKTTMEEARAQ